MTLFRRSLAVAAIALGAASAAMAQTPTPPPAPVRDSVRRPGPPAATPSPATVRPGAPAQAAAAQAPVTAPIRPAGRVGELPDSARPAAAAVDIMPANAVARCADGTWVLDRVEARACAARGGVAVVLPAPRAAPQRAARTVTPQAVAAPARAGARPANATMQCRDGTYLTGPAAAERCDAAGGVAVIFPAPNAAPPAAPPRP